MCKLSGDGVDDNAVGRWPGVKRDDGFIQPKWIALRRDNEAEIRTGYKRGSQDRRIGKTPHEEEHTENDGEILVVLEIV